MKHVPYFVSGMVAALLLSGMGFGAAGYAAHDAYAAQDQERTAQGEARREMRAGNQLSLRQIERRVLPRMRGSEYLGPTYNSAARVYRLKFIKDGRVEYVDVDARTGKIISRSR